MKSMHKCRPGAVLLVASAITAAAAQAPPGQRELHAAECVAALKVNTESLAINVKAGRSDLRPLLLTRLQAGTAFVGDTFLHDDQDEQRARALTDEALERQKSLTEAQLAARQAFCADEGARLLASANAIERVVVNRLARKRMDRLLGS
ncbi:MAG: hypothetical protein ABIO45_06910 [Burkholderiaceae bacterium]